MAVEHVMVGLGSRSYEIVIGTGVRLKPLEGHSGRRMVVTDSNVKQFWGEWAAQHFGPEPLHVLPAGEEHKTLSTVGEVCREAARRRLDRKSLLIAVGGGVTGDMTGFAAAIYMRGIDFIQVPTTLLAMVDSSVGGKTGVDLPEGKNLIGAFHQPRGVRIDPEFLKTLPVREIRCGLAEIVKTGVILDGELFGALEYDPEGLTLRPDLDRYAGIIRRCCELKAGVVAADERESGVRAILNYGHTFGHAVELLSGFTIGHGEAVAIGMCAAGELSRRLGRWSGEEAARQERLLDFLGLPRRIPAAFDPVRVLEAMRLDKKNRDGAIALVLPSGIGRAEVVRTVPDAEILGALEAVHA